MIDPLQDPADRWDDDFGAQVDRAYDRLVAEQVEDVMRSFPRMPDYLTWRCPNGKRSSPCSPSCIQCDRIESTDLKHARIEADRRQA
ncbi:hypothetical protein ABH922_002762 [Rhodococcus sp. 27YEA15]|uniref:hypothetical protein n=1 Tax=Rhodococcus sp. 27YEA15 TaxID=3156259 RepID=UPI003C7A6FD5